MRLTHKIATLQSLLLAYNDLPDNLVLLPEGHWPRLRRLSLSVHLQEQAFSRFLDAHPSLEFLEWDYFLPQLANGTLHSLRHLLVPSETVLSILSQLERPQILETLSRVDLRHSHWSIFDMIDNTRLHRLELSFFN